MSNQDFIAEATAIVTARWAGICPGCPLPTIVVNARLRTAAGRANYRTHTIEINPHLYARISGAERESTTIHEMAHLASFVNHGTKGKGHGYYWKQTMRALGQSPDRCHDYDVSGLVKRYPCRCQCGTIHQLTGYRRNMLTRGTGRLRCNICRNYLTREQLE